jgi:hypothetical protein
MRLPVHGPPLAVDHRRNVAVFPDRPELGKGTGADQDLESRRTI